MDDEKIFKHPSYGMVGIHQVSGKATLVGSAVQHQHFIILSVHEAERHYDLNREWWFARKEVCQIALSHAQLAEMLFSINHGDGVPCTIKYVIGDEGYRPEPPYESPFKEATEDLKQSISRLMETATEFAKEAETLIAKGLSTKKDRERLKFLAGCIVEHVQNHVGFASKSVDEKMEKVVAHAKSEIETFTDMKLRLAGIEAIKEQIVSFPISQDRELAQKGNKQKEEAL